MEIKTLVKDIYRVLEEKKGWTTAINEDFSGELGDIMQSRLAGEDQPRGTLRLSGMGKPCGRQLWYSVNTPDEAEPISPSTRLKFLYGDMLEVLLLSLAKAAGHRVEGLQSEVKVCGIKGHRDAVIDGITVDVKSASSYSFQKFKKGLLRDEDPFGYISQLSSYVYAARDEPAVSSTHGAFLVIDKVTGNICLDMYNLSTEVAAKDKELRRKKKMVAGGIPDRSFEAVPQTKTSPNTKLDFHCSYCPYKAECWPEARKFIYSYGPQWLIDVENEPKVIEDLDWREKV
jgi:hypothetical protein